MKNSVQDGKVIDFTEGGSADVKSGDVVVIGGMCGVAAVDIPKSGTGSVYIEGVFEIAKAAEDVAQGDHLYFDDSAKKLTKTATDNVPFGFAVKAAGALAETVNAKLWPFVPQPEEEGGGGGG